LTHVGYRVGCGWIYPREDQSVNVHVAEHVEDEHSLRRTSR